MITTIWKIAARTLVRDWRYTLINVGGLSVAVACCLLLGTYLRSELTYDRYQFNHERIFRIANELNINGRINRFAVTSPMLGPMLAEDNANVLAFVRFFRTRDERYISHGANGYYWRDVYTADPSVFRVFTHDVAYGDPDTALNDPLSAAVSRSFARHYFGGANPIGETITLEDGEQRRITLVFEDQPENTHFKYDVLLSTNYETFATPHDMNQRRQQLANVSVYTYVLMPAHYNPRDYDAVSRVFFDRYMADGAKAINMTWRSWLQPLDQIHLYSDVSEDRPTTNWYQLYGFVAVVIFTLLIACINYINLATARAAKRVKEVGMRKVLGSSQTALAAQFLAEAISLALLATMVGALLAPLAIALTPIDQLLGKNIGLNFTRDPGLLSALLGLAIVIGLGSGLYPALLLSSIKPTAALGSGGARRGRSTAREALVLLQFAISIAVIACSLLTAAQMRYVSKLWLGFERENRLTIALRGVDLIKRSDTIRTELLANPNVLGVSWSASMMGQAFFPMNVMRLENDDGVFQTNSVTHMGIGPGFLHVMDMKLLEGRDFRDESGSEGISELIVNSALVRSMGWTSAIGKHFEIGPANSAQKGTVVGVVNDFNFQSLHDEVAPFALYRISENFDALPPSALPFQRRFLVLNIAGDNISRTIDYIRSTIARFDAQRPFEFQFLDDTLNQLYLSEERMMKLIGIFAGLCIFIACLGLAGLSAFTTEQRTREIGLRKVLGARTWQLVALFARRTIVLVIAGAAIASVIAYFTIEAWLSSFSFRAPINPILFVVATAGGLGIAYVTVALQCLKAARTLPARALRHE